MAAKIPWMRVAVEGMVIVVSILMAFGIEAMWQERNESRQLISALTSLESVLASEHERLSGAIDRVGGLETRLRAFLDPDQAPLLNLDSTRVALAAIYIPGFGVDNSEELLASLGNEALRDLDDPPFRSATARLRGGLEILRARQEAIYRHSELATLALARHPATRASLGTYAPIASLGQDALQVARADDEVIALAVAKLQHLAVLDRVYSELSGNTEEVLRLVREHRSRE